MFFQCPNCKKTWQYPIDKCLDCFVALERMETKKANVIGVSKTTVSTIQHTKVPYFVLLLEDEKGNRWAQKSKREYKKGEEIVLEIKKDKNIVAVWRIKYDVLEGIEKAIDLLGGLTVNREDDSSPAQINPETKILILPALEFPKHPYFAANTNPRFLGAMVKYLVKIGADTKNIKVAAQSFNDIPIEASAQKSLLFKTCLDYGIIPLDLSGTSFVKKTEDGMNFEISQEAFDADLIINLPILKTGKASSSENIMKLLKKENYLGLKYLYSAEEIAEKINKVLPPYLTVSDGEIIQKSNQFTFFLGIVLAGFNPLNIDRVFNEIIMFKSLPESLKKIKIEEIETVGREIEEVQCDTERT
ncbi:MAG: DUF362 domain-containing protein [Parcubacteria group bacterium]|nr:MAG: DUF362 domain-containing protein [Parcubacteria group bacterium]